jgi:Ca2+-binding EF-hand superfamily protein
MQKRKPTVFQDVQLPERVIMDIKDAFAYFDPESQGFITVSQLKALLQYIAGGVYARKDLERAMKEIGDRQTIDLKDAEKIAYNVWIESGHDQESRDMFKLFDKKEKGTTTMEEIKSVLQSRIAVPVLDEDIDEIMQIMGVGLDTAITAEDLVR